MLRHSRMDTRGCGRDFEGATGVVVDSVQDGPARTGRGAGTAAERGGEHRPSVFAMVATPPIFGDLDMTPLDPPAAGTPAPIDYAAIKARQQATWASGDFAVVGTTLQIVGESLAEAADVKAGERVIDVAAGNGNATLAAARR